MATLAFYDLILDSVPYMLARGSDGAPLWTEQAPQGAPEGLSKDEQRDFSGGVGLTARTGTAEGQRMLAASSATTPGTLGGGVDGRYGFLMPSYETTSVTIDTNNPVRDLKKISFNSTFLAAADEQVWSSTDLAAWASSVTFAANCLELHEFQGLNSVPIVWAAIENQPYQTWDGTTWAADAATKRTGVCSGFLTTQDNGATYTDATTSVSDNTAASVATLTGIDTVANGDWILVGYPKSFSGLTIDMTATVNATASVLAVHYWSGSAWTAVSGLSDGTAAAGATFGQDGTISWTRPAAEWVKTKISNESLLSALFWVRLSVTAALDSATVTQCDIRYQEEASSWATVGKRLHRAFDKNRVATTENGGRTATWNDGADAQGSYTGKIVGLMSAADLTGRGASYLLRNAGLSAAQADGSFEEYMPELWSAATNSDDIGYCVWLGELFFAGAVGGTGFYRMNPIGGQPAAFGPERLMLAEETSAQGRVTAACPDRASFLWASLYNPVTAKSYLWCYGGYRPEVSEGGAIQTGRYDVWNMTTELGSVKVQSMLVTDLSNQAYLLLGTSTGLLLKQKLPSGHPLEANSGCRWTTVGSSGFLPTIVGDPSRKVLCSRITVTGRNMSASNYVTIQTKEQKATSWTSQGTITASGTALTLSSPFAGYGMDVRLDFTTATATAPALIESIVCEITQDMEPARRARTVPLLVGDHVRRRDGAFIPRRGQDWLTLLDASIAKCNSDSGAVPISLTWNDGSTHTVWARLVQQTAKERAAYRSQDRVVAVQLLEA